MAPEPFSKLTVSSGALCYGSLHNIWHGASQPIQAFPTVRPETRGTVTVHDIEYNTAAQNGTWYMYQLEDLRHRKVAAWFLAHSEVDPESEIDKILRVAGSPYEDDSGSFTNEDSTAAEGIFVINRYDWSYYDERCKDEIGEGKKEEGNMLANMLANWNSLGVADYSEARAKVQQWRQQQPSQRDKFSDAAWLYIPGGEYMFGRFGFNESHTAARSFLFFSTNTDFTQTAFAGSEQTLRQFETEEERFERRLREGHDFSGLQLLRQFNRPPSGAECSLHERHEHILTEADIEAVRKLEAPPLHPGMPPGKLRQFQDPNELCDLINEIFLSYLERNVVPRLGSVPDAMATTLFPEHASIKPIRGLDRQCYRCFKGIDRANNPDFDSRGVCDRIRVFFEVRSSITVERECIEGLCRVIEYLLDQILINTYFRSENTRIMPSDIRIAVSRDRELLAMLQFSTVLWEGRNQELPL